MRRLFSSLLLFAVVLAGVGYFRGWFELAEQEQRGDTGVNITIHKQKIREDAEAAREKLHDLRESIEERREPK